MEQKNDFSTIMTGRRSVRVYDETYKIPHEEIEANANISGNDFVYFS